MVEEGASLIARALDTRAFDSSDGYVFRAEGALILSSGWINLLLSDGPAAGSEAGTGVNIDIGACVTDACNLTTTLVSDGTIAIATNRALTIADNVSYGTKNLVLAVAAVNLGETEAIAAAAASAQLPGGLVLNQAKLAELLAGNTAVNAPALETLVLNANEAVNVYGAVELDAASLERIVFGTPAIYGYGAAGDIATIRAAEFIWTGANGTAGAPITGLLGDSALVIEANSILFGYGPNTQPASTVVDSRIALGFANVSLNASERIAASGESSLSVYQSRGDYVAGAGWQYAGGDLAITAPLVTGEAGSKFNVMTGGDVTIARAEGAPTDLTSDVLGAQLAISGRSVTVDTAVVLPSGKLTLSASNDVTLGENARIDLAGRAVTFFDDEDATQYSWGGDLVLTSTGGDITAAAGSSIDLSAEHNRGGTLTVTALGAEAGHVDLAGAILGSASGKFEAGGTYVPYDAAEFTVRAQTLADFAALNERLNEGNVTGARRFQIKQGDLVVGNEVKARDVEIVVDGGDLTVDGTIDASGYQVGSITLAAMGDLTVNGTLDAHGTGLRVDSYGKIIDSPNRATVALTSREGTLTLADGAHIDLRTGADVAVGTGAGQYDGVARGTLDLNAARVGNNDVAIHVAGTPTIQGAKTVAVNAFRTYDDAPLADLPDVSGERPQLITQAYLDVIDGHSQAFINAALLNTGLSSRLAGLGDDYHLRPGVEIISNAETNPAGTLTVAGDLDLSGYRYGPEANRDVAALRGYGEPGVLVLRAAGDLNIHGSINDGFAPPVETIDDNGWILSEGSTPYGGDIVIPIDGVVLDAGTTFAAGVTLNYDVPLTAMRLASGTLLPIDVTLTANYSVLAGTVIAANIYNADGSVAHAAGTVLADAITLTAGMKLGAGTTLTANAQLAPLTWPKGVALPTSLTSNGSITNLVTSAHVSLARGSILPSMTNVQLLDDASIDLRSIADGRQGTNWAVASMLGEGATSWTMNLVAGADLSSADVRAFNPTSSGAIVLADTHYLIAESGGGGIKVGGLNLTGANALVAAFDLPPSVSSAGELVGKTENEIVALYGAYSWDDFEMPGFWDASAGHVQTAGLTLQGANALVSAFDLPTGVTSVGELVGKTEAEIVALYGAYSWDDFEMPGFWDESAGNIQTAGLTLQGANTLVSAFDFPPGVTSASELVGKTQFDVIAMYGAYSWDDFEMPAFWDADNGNSTLGEQPVIRTVTAPSFSVVRTGTSDLSLISAGDIRMESLFGIYTAGRPTSVDEAYNQARGTLSDGSLLGERTEEYSAILAAYEAYYPDQGGNLLISTGGNLVGDILENGWASVEYADTSSVVTGNWLWRQGSGGAVTDKNIPTAWWVNFGNYARVENFSSIGSPIIAGFTGFGTLGGGNVTVRVGGDAGKISPKGIETSAMTAMGRSEGLVLAIASTGRVGADGSLSLSGGGDLNVRIAGALNPYSENSDQNSKTALGGSVINLRGLTSLNAASIGDVQTAYRLGSITNPVDPRGADPFAESSANSYSGLILVPGDSAFNLQTLGDMVIAGAGDATRSRTNNTAAYVLNGTRYGGGGHSWFSLWTDNTAINLTSLGGNLAPSKGGMAYNGSEYSSDLSEVWPSILRVSALGGDIYFGATAGFTTAGATNDVLAPSSGSELSIIAAGSIYGGGPRSQTNAASRHTLNLSATGTPLPTPTNPAFVGQNPGSGTVLVSNLSIEGEAIQNTTPTFRNWNGLYSLFAFGPNTAANGPARSADAEPIRIYALEGDIVGLRTGQVSSYLDVNYVSQVAYGAAAPVRMRAGRDIVSSGTTTDANLILHSNETDVSVISAGRDIIYSNFDIAGPGVLEVSVGRNILQEDQGSFRSIGAIRADDLADGASIVLMAGMANGVNWDAVRDLYLDPANRADPARPLAEQNGVNDEDGTVYSVEKVVQTYEGELTLGEWLRSGASRSGYTGDDAGAESWLAGQDTATRANLESRYQSASQTYLVNWLTDRYADFDPSGDALAYFDGLAPEQQRIFLRRVYFTEIREGGREYNNADSARSGSYLRGRLMAAALFPDGTPVLDAEGNAVLDADGKPTFTPIERSGDIIMFGGSGVRTDFGGDIEMMAPGGQIVIGVQGTRPPATAGVMTQGKGDIRLFSEGSQLLGLSRIMTTYGGDIIGWSEEGDINAGRGAQTDVLMPPARRTYDSYGNVTLAPQVPSSGAGIATLNPIPEIAPGDIDLVAPLGTIDAGEAGIRVSGNINLAAMQVLNAANIKVQGESAGIPVIAAVNTGALTSAASASSAVANQAAELAERARPQGRTEIPTILNVRFLGFGD